MNVLPVLRHACGQIKVKALICNPKKTEIFDPDPLSSTQKHGLGNPPSAEITHNHDNNLPHQVLGTSCQTL